MATPPPGYVRDLAGAFNQAGASAASVAPGASSAPAAHMPVASAPPAAPAPTLAMPVAPLPPASAAFFVPPAPMPLYQLGAAPAVPALAPSPLGAVYINQHVPVVLSLHPSNYSPWRTMFELAFAKFGVMEHILGPPCPTDAQWVQDDAFITSWLYNRVSPEILSLVHQRHPTAASVWSTIASLFLDNAETQAVFIGTDFRRLEQGDMSMLRYFARLKEYADQLADLGFPVDDKAQVMNMFRGLNPRYFYAIPILTMQAPFPSFLRCRAFLILEESRLNMASPPPPDTALHASRAPPPAAPAPAPYNNTGNSNRNGNRNRNRNRGKGKAAQQSTNAGSSSSGSSFSGRAACSRHQPMDRHGARLAHAMAPSCSRIKPPRPGPRHAVAVRRTCCSLRPAPAAAGCTPQQWHGVEPVCADPSVEQHVASATADAAAAVQRVVPRHRRVLAHVLLAWTG